MNTNETMNHAAKTAQFKFGLIAPVIQGLFPDASRTAFYKRVAEKPIEFPDGSVREISFKTLELRLSARRDRCPDAGGTFRQGHHPGAAGHRH